MFRTQHPGLLDAAIAMLECGMGHAFGQIEHRLGRISSGRACAEPEQPAPDHAVAGQQEYPRIGAQINERKADLRAGCRPALSTAPARAVRWSMNRQVMRKASVLWQVLATVKHNPLPTNGQGSVAVLSPAAADAGAVRQ